MSAISWAAVKTSFENNSSVEFGEGWLSVKRLYIAMAQGKSKYWKNFLSHNYAQNVIAGNM